MLSLLKRKEPLLKTLVTRLNRSSYVQITIITVKKQSAGDIQAHFTCMSYVECLSVTVSTIFCFNPKLRLHFLQNWLLLYINENANHCAQLRRSSYHTFTFLCLPYGNLVQNNQIVKVLWISTHQTLLRGN